MLDIMTIPNSDYRLAVLGPEEKQVFYLHIKRKEMKIRPSLGFTSL